MKTLCFLIILFVTGILPAWAGDEIVSVETNKAAIDAVQSHANYLWTLIAAILVFFMQAGFALVEAGFTRAKMPLIF
ncbi:MAG: hypothetical protein R2860_08115 [Desulfobacterales bacterium]